MEFLYDMQEVYMCVVDVDRHSLVWIIGWLSYTFKNEGSGTILAGMSEVVFFGG